MTDIKTAVSHPSETELADFLSGALPAAEKKRVEEHIAVCAECLANIVSAHESVEEFNAGKNKKKGDPMKKINIYLVLTVISFALSFIMPRYFIQFLVATLLFGIKWIVDAKSTKMLVMIYEAWKTGGEKEASRIMQTLETRDKRRF